MKAKSVDIGCCTDSGKMFAENLDGLASRLQRKAYEALRAIEGHHTVNRETNVHYIHALMYLDAIRSINDQFGTEYDVGPERVKEYFEKPRPPLELEA